MSYNNGVSFRFLIHHVLRLWYNFFSGPIKEDSNFKDDEDPSVDYVDIIGTEEQLVSILVQFNYINY